MVDAAHASAEAIKKYDNSNLLITGKKIISIREVLNKVGKILNIKNIILKILETTVTMIQAHIVMN